MTENQNQSVHFPSPPPTPTHHPVRRPRRQNNEEDVDYSGYMEIVSTKQHPVVDLKRSAAGLDEKHERSNDEPGVKKFKP